MINDPNVESHNKNKRSFMIIRTNHNFQVSNLRGEGREVSSALFWKYEKSALILGKTLIVVIYGLNFLFKVQFLRVSRRKNRRFFPPAGPLFFVLQTIVF